MKKGKYRGGIRRCDGDNRVRRRGKAEGNKLKEQVGNASALICISVLVQVPVHVADPLPLREREREKWLRVLVIA